MQADELEAFPIKPWPVGNAAEQGSGVDKIKVIFAKQPRLREIVNFKVQIGGYHGWLGRTEIRANDLILSDRHQNEQ